MSALASARRKMIQVLITLLAMMPTVMLTSAIVPSTSAGFLSELNHLRVKDELLAMDSAASSRQRAIMPGRLLRPLAHGVGKHQMAPPPARVFAADGPHCNNR